MRKPDELEIIKIFQNRFGRKSSFVANDLEFLKMSDVNFVVKSDMLVQGTDVPPGMKLRDISRKSIVSCVSDFACKGIRPRYATISLALPRGITKQKVNELAEGFAIASKQFGIKIVGGDINEGQEIVIDVSIIGIGDNIVSRSGAKNGDIIITSGPFGYTSSGLEIILHNLKAETHFLKNSRKSVFMPTPRLEFGLKAAKYFSSSMDSSDGLSITLNDMCAQSRKRFVITRLPVGKDIVEFARKNRISLIDLVFCGGEEYEIVATVSQKNLGLVRKLARKFDIQYFEIGYVTSGKNVVLVDKEKERTIKRCGWIHLKS
ncbi:MAG: thiamine-phosphate kinase [Nitrosotalea sp.]